MIQRVLQTVNYRREIRPHVVPWSVYTTPVFSCVLPSTNTFLAGPWQITWAWWNIRRLLSSAPQSNPRWTVSSAQRHRFALLVLARGFSSSACKPEVLTEPAAPKSCFNESLLCWGVLHTAALRREFIPIQHEDSTSDCSTFQGAFLCEERR